MKKTITAISTAPGKGALAVIRISGDDCFDIVKRCIKEKIRFEASVERNINVYTIEDEKQIIDEITAIKYRSPKSFTGENMVEIICHGGKVTVDRIIEVLIKNGAKIAQKGEFTRRAFENDKIDMFRAEAICEIINSETLIENQNALKSYYGQSYNIIQKFKNSIIEILSENEAVIEFSEEDDIKDNIGNLQKIDEMIKILEGELKRREVIKEVNKGINLIIAGPPNAGKSTLFNKILGFNRSIVNDIPGTTRDLVSEYIKISNKNIKIHDSAGIRKTENSIEKEGIRRSKEIIQESSIILWITAVDEYITKEEIEIIEEIKNKKVIFVLNKSDKGNNEEKENYFNKIEKEILKISAEKDSIEEIIENIEEIIDSYETNIEKNEIIINERQEQIIRNIYDNLINCKNDWEQKEIVSYHLQESIKEIEILTGKIGADEILNNIFDRFCIGK